MLRSWTWPRDSQHCSGESPSRIGGLCWVYAYWFSVTYQLPQRLWCGMYLFYFSVLLCGIRCLKVGGLGPSSNLFAGPSFSKHLGGKGIVVAAHRVVMDTLHIQLGVTHGPTFLISGTIPQAYLL